MSLLPIGMGFVAGLLGTCLERSLRRKLGFTPVPSLHFARSDDCVGCLVRELKRARQEIVLPAISFSCPPLAVVLRSAIERGIAIHLCFDRCQMGDGREVLVPQVWRSYRGLIDTLYPHLQDQIAFVIDRQTVITGRFRFGHRAAETYAESLLILHDCSGLAEAYARHMSTPINERPHQNDAILSMHESIPRRVA